MSRLAIFDLDGTLLDSAAHCASIVNAMLTDRGSLARVSDGDARRHISLGAAKLISSLMGPDSGDVDRSLSEFRARYAETPTPDSSLFPGVREGIVTLKASGVSLAVCSNKPEPLCVKALTDLGLAAYFDAVVGSAPALPSKPDPAHIERAVARAGGERSRRCYVGDSEVDYLAARAAGMGFIFVSYGYAEPGFDPIGARRAESFEVVPSLVEELLVAAPARVSCA